jgi:hypothetical protein
VEHELLTLLKHMSLSPIFVGFMLHDHIVMSSVLYITVCPFVLSPFLCIRHILENLSDPIGYLLDFTNPYYTALTGYMKARAKKDNSFRNHT